MSLGGKGHDMPFSEASPGKLTASANLGRLVGGTAGFIHWQMRMACQECRVHMEEQDLR